MWPFLPLPLFRPVLGRALLGPGEPRLRTVVGDQTWAVRCTLGREGKWGGGWHEGVWVACGA